MYIAYINFLDIQNMYTMIQRDRNFSRGWIWSFEPFVIFLAVAREENMTEAANVLHVTQPTLSRQIGDLERELGVELFERTNRSCVLTSEWLRLRHVPRDHLACRANRRRTCRSGAWNCWEYPHRCW